MIQKAIFEQITCDKCGEECEYDDINWFPEDESEYYATEHCGWVKDGDKIYCEKCADDMGLVRHEESGTN